jgi:hypothetical protein
MIQPQIGDRIKHPAEYSNEFFPYFTDLLFGYKRILDPMAGTGKIAMIKALQSWHGWITCNDLEPDWKCLYDVNDWHHTDASHMDWADNNSFDAIITSPTYGNRFADHWNRKDTSKRYSYFFNLGHDLQPENTGIMHWGNEYRAKHILIWKECTRVLQQGGRFILNVKNFIKNGKEIDITSWHKEIILGLGCYQLTQTIEIPVKGMRNGANNKLRVDHESLLVFDKVL